MTFRQRLPLPSPVLPTGSLEAASSRPILPMSFEGQTETPRGKAGWDAGSASSPPEACLRQQVRVLWGIRNQSS